MEITLPISGKKVELESLTRDDWVAFRKEAREARKALATGNKEGFDDWDEEDYKAQTMAKAYGVKVAKSFGTLKSRDFEILYAATIDFSMGAPEAAIKNSLPSGTGTPTPDGESTAGNAG